MSADVCEQQVASLQTQQGKYLIFSLGTEEYGIEICYVSEIIGGVQEITSIPELPEYVKGVINLRGKIIPVMDVRIRFKSRSASMTSAPALSWWRCCKIWWAWLWTGCSKLQT